ncbi:MAG: hypothetical protein ACLQEQ_00645 [Nitrososphaerales archaeon]
MLDPKRDDDDKETQELDKKVEDLLRDIAKASATLPQAFGEGLAKLMQDPNHPVDEQKVTELLTRIYKELPSIASILGNWTTSLAAYANYRALKRQEKINEQILKSNRQLAYATVSLAVATFFLVVVTVVYHL